MRYAVESLLMVLTLHWRHQLKSIRNQFVRRDENGKWNDGEKIGYRERKMKTRMYECEINAVWKSIQWPSSHIVYRLGYTHWQPALFFHVIFVAIVFVVQKNGTKHVDRIHNNNRWRADNSQIACLCPLEHSSLCVAANGACATRSDIFTILLLSLKQSKRVQSAYDEHHSHWAAFRTMCAHSICHPHVIASNNWNDLSHSFNAKNSLNSPSFSTNNCTKKKNNSFSYERLKFQSRRTPDQSKLIGKFVKSTFSYRTISERLKLKPMTIKSLFLPVVQIFIF